MGSLPSTSTVDLELCWGTLSHLTVVDQIRAAGAAGFRFVTVSPSQYRQYVADTPDGAAAVRRALDETDIRVTVVDCLMSGLPGSPDAATAPPEYQAMFTVTADDCFAILDAVGGDTLQVAHFLGTPVSPSEMTDAVAALAERARRRGFNVFIEFMPGTGIPDYPTASAIVQGLSGAGVSVMFDTWHFARTGGRQEELEGMTPGIVGGLQLNDCPMPAGEMAQLGYVPMSDRIVPGEGVFPLGEVLTTILARSAPVRAGIEVFSSRLRAMAPVDAARLVRTATAGVLEQIGYTAT